jgi:hypothetical protein
MAVRLVLELYNLNSQDADTNDRLLL